MFDAKAVNEAILDVTAPDASTRSVRVTQSPFLIGRGGGAGNQLQLSDGRISRSAAAIFFDDCYYLEDRNARLVERERERQRLEQELSIAREIQQALLPGGFRNFPYLAISGTNSPCQAVGGDYFDIFPLSDDRTAFLIADVSGKGLGAALLTQLLQGALSGMRMGADPAEVFNHINRFWCEHSEVGRYATMFFGTLHREGCFEFINAGHPSPLLLRAGEVSEPFTEGGFPVGLISDATYVGCSAALRPGDTLVLYSDGVTEAANAEEEMFGITRLRELLVGLDDAPLEGLQGKILESVQDFSRGVKQADDITLLLARYRGTANPAAPAK